MIYVRPGRQFPVLHRHPWVHLHSLVIQSPEPELGATVDLVQQDGRWLARGLYNPQSRLRVRLFTWDPAETIDDAFFKKRIDRAIARREPLGLGQPDQAVRLIFSESDGLSGLIVDRYGESLVVQLNGAVLQPRLPSILDHLRDRLAPHRIIVRIEEHTAKAEGLTPGDQLGLGTWPEEPVLLREHDLIYQVDLRNAQKTGLYLDQRDNRMAAARYLRGKRVLDICSYVGGFALVAAKHGGAAEVVGVDTSAWAVETARQNAVRNGLDQVRFEIGDMFDSLKERGTRGEKFDAVILDPPRLAGSREQLPAAIRAYERLNREALKLLPPGGILVTCSCSGRVARPEFVELLQRVAQKSGRDLLLLEHRSAAPDHPVQLTCPETDYLKCCILEVG